MSTLLDWIDSPAHDRGIFTLRGDLWELHSYAELAGMVRGVSAQLVDCGVRPGDRVVVAAADEPLLFTAGFFGTLLAGAAPVPVAPPSLLPRDYHDYLASLLLAADPRGAIVPANSAMSVRQAARGLNRPLPIVTDVLPTDVVDGAGHPRGLGLLQFTSGSSGPPRPVEVTRAQLSRNIDMIAEWLSMDCDDVAATWLPLYHDMGLIGCFLTPVVRQFSLRIMSPERFVMRPRQWLECFGLHGATLSGAPNFAFSYVCRRVTAEQLVGCDFGAWRAVVIGAEPIDGATLAAFARLLAPFGFRPDTLRPAYGLAEATLIVSGHRGVGAPRVARVDPNGRADFRGVERQSLVSAELGSDDYIVSSGAPLPGTSVRIVGQGGELADGLVGEVVVSGPCVARGYGSSSHEMRMTGTRFDGDELFTGDAGFCLDGELFVLGRFGDSFKVNGQSVFAEHLEKDVAAAIGASSPECAVVRFRSAGRDVVAAVGPFARHSGLDVVTNRLRVWLGRFVEIRVYNAQRSELPRTTSGKLRRSALADMIASGELGTFLEVSPAQGGPESGSSPAEDIPLLGPESVSARAHPR